jgi:WhiB family transcriptional regulator, redox-sensing transcriptional regulator
MSMTWKRNADWNAEDWRDDSACRDVHPSVFFPVSIEDVSNAKAICRTCAVKDQCLDFALRANQEAGIWGGTTEDERRRLRRQWLAARRRARAAGIAV